MADANHDDVDFEPEDELGSETAFQAKLKKVRELLADAVQKRDEYLTGWQRCKADTINAKSDAQKNAERTIERAKDALILDILSPLDSFDMAMSSTSWDALTEEWKSGVGRIHAQLLDALQKNGVVRFGKSGELFDPARHEAVQEVDDGGGEAHTILKVLRHGYLCESRVIRPAQVIVRS